MTSILPLQLLTHIYIAGTSERATDLLQRVDTYCMVHHPHSGVPYQAMGVNGQTT